jgi:hypothetical protein
MQTFLHGRDLIGDLDFSKEEVETVLDVAFDLKRKRAHEPIRICAIKFWRCCSSSAAHAPVDLLKQAWLTGRSRRFH